MPTLADYYVSKRDGWLVAVIWGATALGLAALLPALNAARSEPLARLGLLAMCAGLGIGPWVLYRTGYAFEHATLRISCGLFRWRVPFAEISRVEPSRNPLSSPACSLDRFVIQYGKREIMISPADREGFLRRLAAVCPHLRLVGERLGAADVDDITATQLHAQRSESAGGLLRTE
jgi:Bacterial PH domain